MTSATMPTTPTNRDVVLESDLLGQLAVPDSQVYAFTSGIYGFPQAQTFALVAADRDPAVDVIALGPIFETHSKQRPDPVVGLDTLRRARDQTSKPLVAIGGIDAGRLRSVLDTGVDAAVVLGAVCRGDVASNCKRLLALAREVR